MNVDELLYKKGIDFIPSGSDYLVRCLNPQHEDYNPSMRIDKITGAFNCFSCGHHGNIYKLFEIHRSFTDVRALQLKKRIKTLLASNIKMPLGAEPFHQDFRGLRADTLQYFGAFLHSEEFKDRVAFPIKDIHGNIVVFQARWLCSDVEPKYVFKPEHTTPPLYPANPELLDNSIILVEGLFDMLNLWDKGLTNVVCTFGTSFASGKKAKHTKKVLEAISQYKLLGVSKIYIMYDGDKAGREATNNLLKKLEGYIEAESIDLDDGVDPGDLGTEDVQSLKELLYG